MSKTVKFTVVYHLEEEVPDDWDEDAMQFYIEENHCLDNHALALVRRMDANPGYCQSCNLGEAFIGHIPFEAIKAAQRHGED